MTGEGRLTGIWLTDRAAGPMRGLRTARLLTGRGLDGDRYALGGGTWARYPDHEKQVTLIDREDVAAVAAATGSPLTPGTTRRNLVTTGAELSALVGEWFSVGGTLLYGVKACPPCRHLERMAGVALIEAMRHRGGINAAVVVGGPIRVGDAVRRLTATEAAARGAPLGGRRPVPGPG